MVFTSRQISGIAEYTSLTGLCLLVLLTGQQWAHASDTHSLTSLRSNVERYLASNYPAPDFKTHLGNFDKRLRLPFCHDISVFKPLHARELGRTTLGVKCNSATRWQIYVPVTIQKFVKVAVANRDYSRGHIMTAQDIKLVEKDISNLHQGYFKVSDDVKGMIARRTIRRDMVLTPGMVKHPRYVKRGDEVTIMAESKNLVIRVKGKAMMDGRKGQKIRVKNLQSKREFQATVVAPGTVRVSM